MAASKTKRIKKTPPFSAKQLFVFLVIFSLIGGYALLRSFAAPAIKNVLVIGITPSLATVTWTTEAASTSEVDYGTTSQYGESAKDGSPVKDHRLVLDSPSLKAGTTYHFIVKSIDAAANVIVSDDKTFSLKGTQLVGKVVNQKNQPLSGAKVTITDKSAVSDKNGQVILKDLPSGPQSAAINYNGRQTDLSVDIKVLDDKGTPQNEVLKIRTASNFLPLVFLILIIGVVGGLLVLRRRRNRTVNEINPLRNYNDQ